MELQYYRCNVCGNLFEIIDDGGVIPICCNEDMELLEANTNEAKQEYHIPEYKIDNNKVIVQIGKEFHPMEEKHYIQWISLKTNFGEQKKYFIPNTQPKAEFILRDNEKIEYVYSYCSLHGLWKK